MKVLAGLILVHDAHKITETVVHLIVMNLVVADNRDVQ